MKIRCESCGAKYSIADNLLKKKVTKFRCKKCGHVMSVQAPDGDVGDMEDLSSLPDAPGSAIDFPDESTQIGQVSSQGWNSANAHDNYGDDYIEHETGYDENMTAAQAYEEAVHQGSYDANAQYGQDYYAQDPAYAQQADPNAAFQEDYESAAGAYPEDDMYGATGLFSADQADWQNVINEAQQAEQAPEEDIYAGMETSISRPVHEESYSENDEALDDEFNRAFEERENELMPRKPARQDYSDIAPNHQEQGIVPLSMARQEIQETGKEEVSTKVFNINALETLRSEREAARKEREHKAKSRKAERKGPAPAAVAETKEPPEWYVIENDEQVGPLSKNEIRDRLKRGALDAEHYIWKEGLAEWKPISEVAALADVLKQVEDEKAGKTNGLSVGSSLPAPSSGNLPAISFAPADSKPIAPPESPKLDDLRSLAGGIASESKSSAPKRPTSMAAALLTEEPAPPPAPSGGFGVLGPTSGPDIATPAAQMTGGFQGFGSPQMTGGFAASPAPFSGAAPAPFTGSPFDKEKKSNTGLIIGISVGAVLFLSLVIGIAVFFAMSGNKNPTTPPVLGAQPVQQPPVALPVQQPVPQPIASATPLKAPTAQPEKRTEPEKRAEPETRSEPAERRSVRRASRRRKKRRASRRRARRRQPAARASGGGDEPPPPPPPSGGGDDPPPPPPPTGGGDGPPLPRMGGGARKSTGLDSGLGNLLGGGGNTPAPRNAAPTPRRRSLPSQLSRSQVMRVIQNNAEQISSCQEKHGKGISRIRASWNIQPTGRTSGVSVSGASGSFASCVKGKIRNWRFPRFSGSAMEIGGVPFQF
ncbi:MAG: zinc-ribbon domain-containing protein [Myxococcales bacterium]|nr:zinc-ribbon domain-containing protein [Myxococcales bacterium]MCB9642881.1 zinc-ribbon domain-containing protein [Myxococcales bacterium]